MPNKKIDNKRNRIFLDYASTTPVDARVLYAMMPYFSEHFGNPSSIHNEGIIAKLAIHDARGKIANSLKAHNDEIIFTGSGTEANALAIDGTIKYLRAHNVPYNKMHLITSAIEHSSVLNAFKTYAKKGARVDVIGVDNNGIINTQEFKKVLTPQTTIVSIMYVNNEIGTIQPITEIAKIIRSAKKQKPGAKPITPYLHTDASQAPLWLTIDTAKLGVDLLTIDAQKIHGPKGVGVLYKKRDVNIEALYEGGGQEQGLRNGTEAVPLIIGIAEALLIAENERANAVNKINELKKYLLAGLNKKVPSAIVNANDANSLIGVPNTISISIPPHDSELLVIELDSAGVAVSSGSACQAGKDNDGSDTLLAIGKTDEIANSSVRISMGKSTTQKELSTFLATLKTVVDKLSGV